MNLENILARLQGVRRSGAGHIARCPAHEDRSPSLSIAEGRDGRVLLNCFAGCPPENIVQALGLTMRDLFSDSPPPLESVGARAATQAVARAASDLRRRLRPRERELPVTFIETDASTLDDAIARGLAVACEGEIVQLILTEGNE
jgi:hypothetical protein